jgi:hypothetical protein
VFFHVFSEHIVPQLLRELCSNEMMSKQHLESQQALFKQFAEILDFVLKFDDLKVGTYMSLDDGKEYNSLFPTNPSIRQAFIVVFFVG